MRGCLNVGCCFVAQDSSQQITGTRSSESVERLVLEIDEDDGNIMTRRCEGKRANQA